MKKILRIVLALAIGTAAIVGIVWFLTADAADAAKKQLEAMGRGDIVGAYAYGSTDFKAATSQAEFETFVNSYEVLNQYQKASFNSRSIENNITTLSGKLTSRSGSTAEVEYKLVKEDGDWKVLSLFVSGAGVASDTTSEIGSDCSTSDKDTTSGGNNVSLGKTFNLADYGYTIAYPSDWVYEESGTSTVVFSGQEGSDDYDVTVNTQNVTGDDVDGLVNDLKDQFETEAENSVLSNEKNYTYTMPDGTKLAGKEFTVEYTYGATDFKQRQIVVPRSAYDILHAWAYTAPADKYDTYLPIANAMLKSWMFVD